MNEMSRTYQPCVGDVVVVDGRRVGDPGRLGQILEAGGEPRHQRLCVRWADGRESILYPGADVRIHPRQRRRAARRTPQRREP